MVDLDLKDRKILYELDLDARQSFGDIGKKVGLSKDSVAYRVKRMEDEGVIKYYWTAINTFKLGYNVFRVYITLQYVNDNIKRNIIKQFEDYKNTWVVATTYRSEVDLAVVLWINNIFEFYQFWEKTLDHYEDYFERVTVSVYTQATCYKKSYLVPDGYDTSSRKMYVATSGASSVSIDDVDYHLLNEIAINARIPTSDLAEKLGCSSQTVNYRLANLIKNGVIQAFRVRINLSSLELQAYKVDIHLRDHRQKKSIIKYLEEKSYFEGLNLAVGWADIEPEFIVKDVNELNKILSEIDLKFPNAIKKQNYWILEKIYKERWLPEIYNTSK
ncbi:MAG: winged helix-turn-helix transcriptional regulator [Candidatus Thermoplasmatota archaeon]